MKNKLKILIILILTLDFFLIPGVFYYENKKSQNEYARLWNKYQKYAQIDEILEGMEGVSWRNAQPSPCLAASKSLKEKLDNIDIASVEVVGVVPGCKKTDENNWCGHAVIGVLVDPQTSQFIKPNNFKPVILEKDYNSLEFRDFVLKEMKK